jgi:hypothetical protein
MHDVDPNKVGDRVVPTATLVGIDEASIEVLTLYLEIIGWRCIVGSSVADLAIDHSHLAFIDESVLSHELLHDLAQYRNDLPIVLIGASLMNVPPDNRFHYLTTPLELKAVETIIERI